MAELVKATAFALLAFFCGRFDPSTSSTTAGSATREHYLKIDFRASGS